MADKAVQLGLLGTHLVTVSEKPETTWKILAVEFESFEPVT